MIPAKVDISVRRNTLSVAEGLEVDQEYKSP